MLFHFFFSFIFMVFLNQPKSVGYNISFEHFSFINRSLIELCIIWVCVCNVENQRVCVCVVFSVFCLFHFMFSSTIFLFWRPDSRLFWWNLALESHEGSEKQKQLWWNQLRSEIAEWMREKKNWEYAATIQEEKKKIIMNVTCNHSTRSNSNARAFGWTIRLQELINLAMNIFVRRVFLFSPHYCGSPHVGIHKTRKCKHEITLECHSRRKGDVFCIWSS